MSAATARRSRRLALAGVLLVIGGLLTACVEVPSSSAPVVVGSAPAGQVDNFDDQLDLQPQGPRPGSSPDTIVRGFISASVTTDPAHPVARQFLTPAGAKTWKDSDSVTVIEPTLGVQLGTQPGAVVLQAIQVGTVDSSGVFTADTTTLQIDLKLTKVSGQWRITNPPTGILMRLSDFREVYQAASVYFLDPTETRVVPDLRYFITTPDLRVNLLVQALIDGPSKALSDGVRNELAGEVDKVSQVSIVDGQARVTLSGVTQKNDTQLKALSAQISWTLRDLPLNSIRIYNDGVPLAVPGVEVDQLLSDWDSYNPDSFPATATGYLVQGGAVLDVTGKAIAGLQGVAANSAGVSLDGKNIAVVSASGGAAQLYRGALGQPVSPVSLPDSTAFTAPTWGPSSEDFWVVRNGTDVVRVPAKGQPAVVSAPGLSSVGTIVQMRRSRDGVRVVFLAEKDGRGTLYLSTVVTSAGGISLTAPQPLARDLDIVAVDWVDARTVVVLVYGGDGAPRAPSTLYIDDSQRVARAIPFFSDGATAIAAAPDRPFLCAGDGVVLRLEESNWVPLIAGTSVAGVDPFYPG